MLMMVHVYTENEIIKEWFREVRINSGKSRFGYYNITTNFDLTLVCWSVIELAETKYLQKDPCTVLLYR